MPLNTLPEHGNWDAYSSLGAEKKVGADYKGTQTRVSSRKSRTTGLLFPWEGGLFYVRYFYCWSQLLPQLQVFLLVAWVTPGSQLEELIQSFKSTEGPRLLRMLLVKLMCPHGRRYLIPQLICRRTWPFSGEFMGCCSDGSPSSFWPCVCSFTSTHSSLLFCFLFAQILPVNGKKYANILRNHLQS